MSQKNLDIPTARVFIPLLKPSRYKAAWGGRGSGKSRFFGGLLIDDHYRNPGMRSVCIREVQKSLKESAKRLLEDCLNEFGLGESDGFKVLNDSIKTPGDGIIIFQGMQDHTADSIKSLEGFDRAWVEEAQTLSATSLRMLRPTIRKPGSEIWFSFNPRRKTDPVDMFLRGEEQPTGAVVVRANWSDNPWFPAELENERLDDLRMNPDQYDHVWEGDYVTVSSGAYFAKHLATARLEHRIGHVAADPLMTYRAFFDIGGTGAKADACSIWICQFVGKEIRVIDYYEAKGQPLAVHAAWMTDNGYSKARVYLPHDGVTHDKVFDVTYESELRRAGFDVPTPVKNQGTGAANQRIEAVRRILPQCWFNEPKCTGGIDALGWYHEKRDENRGIGLGPDHDWSSHGADAFGLMAIVAEDIFDEQNRRKTKPVRIGSGGWMG
jgi:phage terminase large subunit